MNKGRVFLNAILSFLKKFIPVWIVLGVVMVFALVDYINYAQYDLKLVSVYTEENPDGDPNKLYYSTYEKDELLYYKVQVTRNNKPMKNHTMVAVGQKSGAIMVARQVTNDNGEAVFELSVFPVYSEPNSIEAEVQFYDESTAWIIEFRLERNFTTTLYKR